MAATYLPSFVTVHLPDNTDLLLEGRVRAGKGQYGLKPGSREILPGTATFDLDSYDNLITRDDSGRLPLDTLQQSSITVGFAGYTLFSGRVRQAELVEDLRRSTAKVAVQDAITDFAGSPAVNIGPRPEEPTGERINHILDVIGWPGSSAYRDIDPGVVRCVQIPFDVGDPARYGQFGKPLELLNRVSATEVGQLSIRHGRKASDRLYNRGLLSFRERRPADDEVLHIDTITGRLDGVQSVRPAEGLVVQPNREELYNIIELFSPDGVTHDPVNEPASIARFGSLYYPPSLSQSLAAGDDLLGSARFLRSVYAFPRPAVRQVKISPYFYPERVTRRAYRLTVNDVVRLTYQEPNSDTIIEALQQINRVQFEVKPGDNPAGGAVCDITLDLEAPENISSWRYGIRGASELDDTTIFASDPTRVYNPTVPSEPHTWTEGEDISANLWNAHFVNDAVIIYDSEQQRDRTREEFTARLRELLGVPDPGDQVAPDEKAERRLQAIVDSVDFRVRPAADAIGRYVPVNGSVNVLAATLEVFAWNDALGGDQLLASAGARQSAGRWRLDGTARSRLSYGNILKG